MVIALGTAAFFAFGCLLVLVGSVGGSLITSFGISLEEIGALAAALSLGLGAGIVLAGPAVDRWPRRPIFVGAAVLAALAMGWGSFAGSWVGVGVAVAAAGFGAGAFETVLNATLSESPEDGRGWSPERRLALVHSGATLGAVLSPPWFAAAAELGGFPLAFRGLGLGFAGIALLGCFVPFARSQGRVATSATESGTLRFSQLLPLLLAGAAYVGFETAVTAFAPSLGGSPGEGGATSISAFWFGLLLSRLGLLLWRGATGPVWLLAGGVFAGIVVLVGGRPGSLGSLEFGLMGLCLGATFPLLIALTGARFPERRGTALGLLAGAGALGGAAIPWLTGCLADQSGLGAVIGVLGGCCVALACCGGWLRATWATVPSEPTVPR